jgi:hypothetical protein
MILMAKSKKIAFTKLPFLCGSKFLVGSGTGPFCFDRSAPEMEFLNGIFSLGFWAQTQVFSDSSFVWFSTHIFPFYQMLFMNILKFSCFAADFL